MATINVSQTTLTSWTRHAVPRQRQRPQRAARRDGGGRGSGSIVTVYRAKYGDEFEWLLPVSNKDYDLFNFDGTARAASWRPVRMERLKVSGRGRRLKPADFPTGATSDIMFLGH